jgi:hypothetical protein
VLPEHEENAMHAKSTIKIELTPEQKEQIQRLLGQKVTAVKLSLQELEERIAPSLTNN